MFKYGSVLLVTFLAAFAQNVDSLREVHTVPTEKPNATKLCCNPMRDDWFGQDKFLHFSASASITGLTYHVYVCRLNGDEDRGEVYAVSLTAVLGLAKEIYDKKRKDQFSWKDLFWDGLGLAAGYFVFVHEY